jgi:IS30 family transposase
MARHDLLSKHFPDGVYFANPGSPWLRGSNENMNGLLRQYFPKGGDLSQFSIEDLCRVEELLNNRPRRVLGWRTPLQIFTEHLAA